MLPDLVEFYAEPGEATVLPDHPVLADLPRDPDEVRAVVQGVLLHLFFAPGYGLNADDVRQDEHSLRSAAALLQRVVELCSEPIRTVRQPIDRVHCTCRQFALLYTALLRLQRRPVRIRCGFSNYFDRSKWESHALTERWTGARWVRDDPQIDELQVKIFGLGFDPHDQPRGPFLTGSEAWSAARVGEVDPNLFGNGDRRGLAFIAAAAHNDFAHMNKVEVLPWERGMSGPQEPLSHDRADALDEAAALMNAEDLGVMRERYLTDERLRLPPPRT